jgi:uncharacterized protein YjbI with pentapeptide repeats
MSRQLNVQHEDVSGSHFEDGNLSKSQFENINLSGSRFHDINFSDVSFTAAQIGGTLFKHIGPPPGSGQKQRPVTFEEAILTGSAFRRVDLSNVKLTECNMEGMTIDGVLVSDLLEAYKRKNA